MPRKARITAPGILLHIMGRGIEGRDIFLNDSDRAVFVSLFRFGLRQTGYRCYAWALMPNHYHLFLRTSEQPPAALMRRLNSAYSRHYNKTHDRKGYLFGDRYRSIATQDQNYCEEIVRYVHLNPIRAGICKSLSALDRYPWTGHRALMGNAPSDFQDAQAVLRRFGRDMHEARMRYRAFLAEGLHGNIGSECISSIRGSNKGTIDVRETGTWAIGDPEFVRSVIEKDKQNRLRIARFKKLGWTLDRAAKEVATCFNIDVETLRTRSRLTPSAEAKKSFAYICRSLLDFRTIDIGRFLGITGPAASICANRGRKSMNDKRLANLLINLRP